MEPDYFALDAPPDRFDFAATAHSVELSQPGCALYLCPYHPAT